MAKRCSIGRRYRETRRTKIRRISRKPRNSRKFRKLENRRQILATSLLYHQTVYLAWTVFSIVRQTNGRNPTIWKTSMWTQQHGVWRATIFSSFPPLVLCLVQMWATCHRPFSIICIALCDVDCLAQKPTSQLHFMWPCLVCPVTKKDLADTILVVITSSWPRRQKRSKTERVPSSFVGSCVVSFVSRHVRFPQKEHTNNHNVAAERGCCVEKVEDLVSNKVPRDWVLLGNFNNPNDEWKWGRFWWLPVRIQRIIKIIIGSSIWHYKKQQEVESQQKFHHFLMGQHPGVNTRSWSKTGWTPQCLKKQNEDQHWRIDMPENADMYKGPLNRGSLKATDAVKYFRDTLGRHSTKWAHNCVLQEILSVQQSKKRKFRNGQVDRHVCTVFAALKRHLNGQLTDVLHEWRTKTRSVKSVLPTWLRRMLKD